MITSLTIRAPCHLRANLCCWKGCVPERLHDVSSTIHLMSFSWFPNSPIWRFDYLVCTWFLLRKSVKVYAVCCSPPPLFLPPFHFAVVPKKAESWELPATALLASIIYVCLTDRHFSHSHTHANLILLPYVLCNFTDYRYSVPLQNGLICTLRV